ncbi:hypothetical protein C0581_04125 [Candidatus Parcubacteria bacterium]|nr:MAG: hypothetical protein C0581_04125 [Candidatus Parcubacteria bacterium]
MGEYPKIPHEQEPHPNEKVDLNFGGEYGRLALKYELEQTFAKNLEVNPDHVQLTNGSNGSLNIILPILALRFTRMHNGQSPCAVLDTPNYFDTIKFLTAGGYNINEVSRTQTFELNTDLLIKEIKEKYPHLVILTTPNNPTGIPIHDGQIDQIIHATPDDSIVLIDRTCLNVGEEISTKELLKKYAHKKLIILHSFSKTHNMSAERVGFFVTNNDDLASYLQTHEDDGRVNADAMQQCKELINKKDLVEKNKTEIKRSLAILENYAQEDTDFLYTQSRSNFALVRLDPKKADKLKQKFLFPDATKFGIDDPCIFRLNLSDSQKIKMFIGEYKNVEN